MKRNGGKLDVRHGNENTFHDFDHTDGELWYLKGELAAEIIGVLDDNV